MPWSLSAMIKDYVREYRAYNPSDPKKWSDSEVEDIKGKIVVVTGCNTGLGKAAVIEFAKRGANVIMACRDMDKTQEAFVDIKNMVAFANLEIMELDLSDLQSVRKFTQKFKEKYGHLNILVNNAGVSKPVNVVEKTEHGFELHMGVNHLGHFLLTLLLLDHLKKGFPSRVVTVSSTIHLLADINLNDLMLHNIKSLGPSNILPYANSKLANILFIRELSKRLAGSGVTTYALCPGLVKTDLARNRQTMIQKMATSIMYKLAGMTPAMGAQTIVLCAISKPWALESGKMYRFEKRWDMAGDALDEGLGLKLWDLSEELVGHISANNNRNSKIQSQLETGGTTAVFL